MFSFLHSPANFSDFIYTKIFLIIRCNNKSTRQGRAWSLSQSAAEIRGLKSIRSRLKKQHRCSRLLPLNIRDMNTGIPYRYRPGRYQFQVMVSKCRWTLKQKIKIGLYSPTFKRKSFLSTCENRCVMFQIDSVTFLHYFQSSAPKNLGNFVFDTKILFRTCLHGTLVVDQSC